MAGTLNEWFLLLLSSAQNYYVIYFYLKNKKVIFFNSLNQDVQIQKKKTLKNKKQKILASCVVPSGVQTPHSWSLGRELWRPGGNTQLWWTAPTERPLGCLPDLLTGESAPPSPSINWDRH